VLGDFAFVSPIDELWTLSLVLLLKDAVSMERLDNHRKLSNISS
jgi:hypothetical protein